MRSLKTQFIMVFGLYMLVSLAVVAVVAGFGIIKTGEVLAETQGIPVVEKAAELIDGDEFEKFAYNNPSTDNPYYEETRKALLDIKNTVGCEYLYTMIPFSGTIYMYVIDGSCDPSDEDNFSMLGDQDDIKTLGDAPMRVMSGEAEISNSGLVKQDEWGQQISTYHSIKNSQGKVVGFIGCDFNTESMMNIMYGRITMISIISVAFVVGGLLLLFFMTRFVFSGMKHVGNAMDEISSGKADLSARIPVNGHDEVATLAKSCNSLVASMSGLVSKLQSESKILSESGIQLSDRMSENVELISEVADDVNEIGNHIDEETRSIEDVALGMHNVEDEITNLDAKIIQQSSAIMASSSAIEQISSNIESVARNVGSISKEYEALVSDSQNGRRMQEDVSEQIVHIAQQSENLNEANTAISAIAEQTNLLAMNAAIEAAHAGEAGKGFAVVADEIRKLSETSTVQSKTIGELLSSISVSISGIVDSSRQSAQAFESVGTKIGQLNDLIREVQSGMDEESRGVSDILGTMKTLDGTTKDIREASAHMKNESKKMFDNVRNLQSLALGTQEKSTHVISSMDAMKNSADSAMDATERNQQATNGVITMINGFKI
ncbi:MAG: methyl-accepting chemotaxis protein [Treponema sp.]|nr:methyl-accepting chemotaxis protein [Treponema sp.]